MFILVDIVRCHLPTTVEVVQQQLHSITCRLEALVSLEFFQFLEHLTLDIHRRLHHVTLVSV